VWAAVADTTRERGCNSICFSGGRIQDPRDFNAQANAIYDLLSEANADGLVIWGAALGHYISPETYAEFCKRYHPLPVVSVGLPAKGIPTLEVDNYQGMRDAITHLVEVHGYQRIVFINGPPNQPEVAARLQAYSDVLKEYDLPFDPGFISPLGTFDTPAGEEAIRVLIDQRGIDFEAVVAASDNLAFDALRALKMRGIRVPNDVAIVGFDDRTECRTIMPPLTTVRQQFREIGRHAVEMVLTLLDGGEVPERVILPTELVVRQSCGCPSLAVTGAVVERTGESDGPIPDVLAKREEVLLEMASVIKGPIEGLETDWAEQLLTEFIAEVESASPGDFLPLLNNILERIIKADGDVGVWQDVISVLRRYTLSHFDGDTETLFRAENLCGQARVMVSERAQQAEARRRMNTREQYTALREISEALITAFNIDRLVTVLTHGLPQLGITSCYLSLYERCPKPNGKDPVISSEWAHLILAYDEVGIAPTVDMQLLEKQAELGESGQRFPSCQLIPGGLSFRQEPFSLVIEPLYFREEQLGFVLLETEPQNGEICDDLRGQISSALKGALLLQERRHAEEGQREALDQALRAAHAMEEAFLNVEGQVEERTAKLLQEIAERKQAQEALAREQYLVRSLLDHSPDHIYFKDTESRFIRINKALANTFGLSDHSGALGKTDFDFFTDEHAQPAYADEQRVMKTGCPIIDKEEKETWLDGRVTWVSTTKLPLRDEKGEIEGTLGMSRNITARKLAEEEIKRHAAHVQALNTIIAAAAAATDMATLVETTLDRTLHALGLEAGNIRIPPHATVRGLSTTAISDLTGTIQTDEPVTILHSIVVENWEQAEDNDPRTAIVSVLKQHGICAWITVPVVAEKGQYIGSFGVATFTPRSWSTEEIALVEAVGQQLGTAAERLRLLDRVREQMQQVQQIIDTVPEGVLLLNIDGGSDSQIHYRVALANPAGERKLRVLANAGVGDTLTYLGNRPLAELLDVPSEGLWHEIAEDNRTFEAIARPLDIKAEFKSWVLVIRDVTQEREAQARIQQQERLAAVGQLAGGIAHDFNNLLTTIMLYAQMPLKKQNLPPNLTRAFETILSESRQATELVRQILDFSRRSAIETRPMNLAPFIKEAVQVLQRTIPENISLLLEIEAREDAALLTVNADPTRIQQVLMNLVVNARDAMPEGGVLRIGVSSVEVSKGQRPPMAGMGSGNWFCLSVSDTGTGIPPEALPHIYEPFFTTKPQGEGTGLGLAQVYGIVKQHDGYITMETELGQGTTFYVYLPTCQVEQEEVSHGEASAVVPEGRGETILLAEDNPGMRQVGQEILEGLGYHVLTAVNGREALEIYQTAEKVDLVLTDVVMPQMGGVALVQELRKINSRVKAVAATGYVLAKDLEELKKEGITDIIHKPFDMDVLAQVIRQVLDEN
jgi:PAS domain S-box-containing protein